VADVEAERDGGVRGVGRARCSRGRSPLGTAAFGLVSYYGARLWRKGGGVDVDLVYRELPPY
jgi:hypothetical protein